MEDRLVSPGYLKLRKVVRDLKLGELFREYVGTHLSNR